MSFFNLITICPHVKQTMTLKMYAQLLKVREQLAPPPFEIPYSDLNIGAELGEGFFGKVHKGILTSFFSGEVLFMFCTAMYKKIPVAVKKITRSSFRENSDIDLFNKEISIMR